MIGKKFILPALLAGGLCGIYFLPQSGAIADSAVSMDLPSSLDGWRFQTRGPSEEEVGALEKGTRFAKAECYRPRPGEYAADGRIVPDFIDLSIVLSGTDLNNSIHRPERCMPAQGHFIQSSSNLELKTADGRVFPVKRLKSVRSIHNEKKEVVGNLEGITYYFFVGREKVVNDHLQRTFFDMKDRLLYGTDQRWAYVSLSSYFGKLPWLQGKSISEAEADERLATFASQLAGDLVDWDKVRP